MSSRTWQKLAAAISVAIMIVVLVKYGLRDDHAPKRRAGAPYVGAQHHPNDIRHMGGAPAPLQVFADAKLGDWIAYRVLNRGTLMRAPITTIVVARITKATDATVTVTYQGHVEATKERHEQWERQRPRQGLTLDQLTRNDVAAWTIYDVTVSSDSHEAGGRTFASKLVTYAAKDPLFPRKRVRNEVWISDEVPVLGLVESRNIQDLGTIHFEQIEQLVGFGTADATTWGTRPEGL